MNTNDKASDLRTRAEKFLQSSKTSPQNPLPEETVQMVHDLQVYQVELMMQNEELRRTQEELEVSREQYFHLYDLAPVGYVTLSEKGLITETNLTFTTLMGLPRTSINRKPISQFIVPEDQDIYYHNRRKLFDTGEPQACEIRMIRTGAEPVWVRMEASLGKNVDGTPVCRAVISDITERKHLEHEHERLQKHLVQAQKMESIGRLAGGVAHDFNNMLMVIIGNTEMAMEDTNPSSPIYTLLQEIIGSAKRSADITRKLLAFARRQAICPIVLNLNDLVSGMIKMIQRLIGENIHLIWKPSADLWLIKMDPSQIDQIFVNLAVNARDAIDGVGTLTIETRNMTIDDICGLPHSAFHPGDYVLLTVRDTGCGIKKEDLENLFEPFYTTKELGKGTGLGLSTIYGIIKQNNGYITVSSDPGQDTIFTIYLPRIKAHEDIKDIAVIEKPVLGSETILLVEDELSILKLGAMILNKSGYTVLDANSPEKAIDIASKHESPIHLLITDVVMPQMNGKLLFEKISIIKPGIKVLFMSGYTADIISNHGVIENGLHFLQKPFSTKTLAATVRKILDKGL